MTEHPPPATGSVGATAQTRRPRGVLISAIVALVVAVTTGVALRPSPGRLPDQIVGDQELGRLGRQVMNADRPALAVACVTTRRSRTAVIGADPDNRFEIGSISKGLTGLLFQTMIDRGEIDPNATLGSILAVQGRLGQVTLAQLATHTSGLPDTSAGLRPGVRGLWATLSAGNPYDHSVRQMISEAQQTPLTAPPGTYSNLGFELLGAALTAVAGQSYPELVHDRVLAPMGMADTTAPLSVDELDRRDLTGRTLGGRAADPWIGEAITPVGGVRSDIGDMSRLARRLLDRSVPGIRATEPKASFGASRIGWAWISSPTSQAGHTVLWHNGGTGGFTAFVGVDRTSDTAVVILSAVQESPDHVTESGFALLRQLRGCPS